MQRFTVVALMLIHRESFAGFYCVGHWYVRLQVSKAFRAVCALVEIEDLWRACRMTSPRSPAHIKTTMEKRGGLVCSVARHSPISLASVHRVHELRRWPCQPRPFSCVLRT